MTTIGIGKIINLTTTISSNNNTANTHNTPYTETAATNNKNPANTFVTSTAGFLLLYSIRPAALYD